MTTRQISALTRALLPLFALACSAPEAVQPTTQASAGSSTADPTRAGLAQAATGAPLPPFDPSHFVRQVTNPLFPLPLGVRLVYQGHEDGRPERVVTAVTRDRKKILGVPVVVVLDRVFLDGELIEKTFDWYAQDRDGNVWYFGEDTREFDHGRVVSTEGSFEAGKAGARAGILMRARPVLSQITPQEFAPGVAEDKAKVLDLDATVTTPYAKLHHCLKQAEFTPLEPDALEYKYYCPGIGVVRERDVRGGTVNTGLVAVRR
jgi:hypothetical protein